jgi:hypothetical protein
LATKNTRNARLLLCATLGGTYVVINKTHGLSTNFDTDFSEDTSHGDDVKSYLPGLQDFGLDIESWYDTAQVILEAAAKNKLSYFFLLYIDYADVVNYYRGQMYIGGGSVDLAIGNTAGQSFQGRIANADYEIVRDGAAL